MKNKMHEYNENDNRYTKIHQHIHKNYLNSYTECTPTDIQCKH